jgi:predicted HicB family RNase H-like nuclease
MARPKSTAPKKKKLTLTVNDTVRGQLTILSELEGVSISQLVEQWTAEAINGLNDKLAQKGENA